MGMIDWLTDCFTLVNIVICSLNLIKVRHARGELPYFKGQWCSLFLLGLKKRFRYLLGSSISKGLKQKV